MTRQHNILSTILLLLLFAGFATTSLAQSGPTPEQEQDGITVGGNTYKPQSRIKVSGNIYGGGNLAIVGGNTHVTINTGELGGEIFGGGNGALNADGTVKASADIGTHNADGTLKEGTGDTYVTINGGEIVYYIGTGTGNNHNVYGGGNLACNVAGSTYVKMSKGIITAWSFVSSDQAATAWQSWYDNHKSDQKNPIAAVFGAGYGANTDVAQNTNVDIDLGTPHTGEYDKDDLVAINGYIVRERPNPGLSEVFVTSVLGGGYNGTVGAYSATDKGINRDKDEYTAQTNITIKGSPYLFNVFGGGLGSKEAADADGNKWDSHVGAVYGGTRLDIQGGLIYGDVFGGGAGINGQIHITTPREGEMPYVNAAQVYRETDVTISGDGTVIMGNLYGGGDIANTGWYTAAARPTGAGHREQTNIHHGTLDYTTSLHLYGGNIMGMTFAGGNGRKKADITNAHLIGSVIGSTNLTLGKDTTATDKLYGTTVWSRIYGGGNAGCVYSCKQIATAKSDASNARPMASGVADGSTNVEIYNGKAAHDIFAGGFGDVTDDVVTSADISGNTYVYFKKAKLEFEQYWDATTGTFKEQSSAGEHRNTESDVCHNLYGGGNTACIVGGHSHVYMTGAPTAPANFDSTDYYRECIANVAKPHFSSFGGGFGMHAEVRGNAYSDINLTYGTGMYAIIGGGMNGPISGSTHVHVGSDPMSLIHHVYGGGYYASCKSTELQITRGTILENVFGGSVMGSININGALTDIATKTIIGLQTPGDGRHATAVIKDEEGDALREYSYEDHKNQITIGGNVYGANDVSGTVNGIAQLTIYGGTIKSDVYGAGNGDHIGYYVPDQLRYDLGEHADNYFIVNHALAGGGHITGKTYVGRPKTTGGVELTMEGNTQEERVSILGQAFGGGNSCTIGQWDADVLASYGSDPHLSRDDPDYFLGNGKIDVTLGSHVTIGRKRSELNVAADGEKYIVENENVSGLYMGCSGRDLATQNGAYTTDNYYHHFFDYKASRYYPGFAVGDELGVSMPREEQLKPFQAYLNNILVWTDDVNLNFTEDAEDIWLANFVGGGFRGSMRLKESAGQFSYTIPEGVTISHAIVGGAYNSHVQYRYFETDASGYFQDANGDGIYDYATTVPAGWEEGVDYIKELKEDPENPDKTTAILRYNFNGGMLGENSTGINSSDVSNHIHTVHADPRTDEAEYTTAYFEPMPAGAEGAEDEATRDKLFTRNKHKALLYLDLRCALEPEVFEADDEKGTPLNAWGGNVYGGCYQSGFVEGDSWVDYSCWLSPNCTDARFFSKKDNMTIYGEVADMERNNALNIFGAGFGTDTHSKGDVYLRIKSIALHAPGDADPAGMFPYIFNAFGGSNMGEVDGNINVYYDSGAQGTLLGSLYGGSFQGPVHGNTFVELASGFVVNVYGGSRQASIDGASHIWAYDGKFRGAPDANHLIICNLYGGNDIAGTINGTMPAAFATSKWDATSKREMITGKLFNSYVEISTDDNSANRGFPLIGSAYAGGNGENWTPLSGVEPTVATALLEIDGGSTLRAFGGGNKATITENTYIFTNAKSTNFAKVTFSEYQKNIMNKVFFSGTPFGYNWEENDTDGKTTRLVMDPYHVVRLFGGNNLATMDIQPTWHLVKGRLGSVYSGGNMGNMTYYNPLGKPATKDGTNGATTGVENNTDGSNSNYSPRGLSITIDQSDIHINSLFGGCRMADVHPTPKAEEEDWPSEATEDDYYGATVNISDGYIENVYGGNDVSGTVYHGTNVNISGAVSGNVYGSGNGFYLYKWDDETSWPHWDNKTLNPSGGMVVEDQITEAEGELGTKDAIYYHVKGHGTETDATGKLLTINEYRPSVEKAFLNISGVEAGPGREQRVAYVKGNVFCGGNASTVLGTGSFTKFKIGSYVTLNGVFMGSDGLDFSQNQAIAAFEKINGFDMSETPTYGDGGIPLEEKKYYDNLLGIYMKAVEMKAQPLDFNLNLPLKEAHIGTYCGGGNRGSMLVEEPVSLPFHHDIIIYDKIVAGCLDANVVYNQNGTPVKAWGGYTRPVRDNAISERNVTGNTKFYLTISSQFAPLVMDVPADKVGAINDHGEDFYQALAHDFLYDNRTVGVKYTYEEFNKLFEPDPLYTSDEEMFANEGEDHWWKEAPNLYAPSCNIYGGCFESGEIEGDVVLNIHSNMLRYVNRENLEKTNAENIACFNVYGAGFGQDSHVWGNVKINMDRSLDTKIMGTDIAASTLSNNLREQLSDRGAFNVWDGKLNNALSATHDIDRSYPSFNNIIGGGRNGKLIGNTQIELHNGLVYADVAGGCYASDMYGSTHIIVGYPQYYRCNTTGEYTVKRADVWNEGKLDMYGLPVIKKTIKYMKGDLVPANIYEQIMAAGGNSLDFTEQVAAPASWDDVHIRVGKGVYGGGYSLANSTAASAGSITTHQLNDETINWHSFNFNGRYGYGEDGTTGYGGNSSIMVSDQDEAMRDHIHISSLHVTPLPKPYTAATKIGKFVLNGDKYTHQGDGTPDPGQQYYDLSGDGGIYGDGHLTFCEGFRTADVTRYGWAGGTAKHPVLMNTFQRIDLLSVNDCCLMLQGAQDFASDQIDATLYSITRVNELRMNSTLDENAQYGSLTAPSGAGGEGAEFDTPRQRNYLAFFNNVHYLGSIITNDKFDGGEHTFHGAYGALDPGSMTYRSKKEQFIDTYHHSPKAAQDETTFKQRNVGTARNAIGINNGYCLRIQNQEYRDVAGEMKSDVYYGPIVGVCEVKLLTLVEGEGGGYVYAQNIHSDEDNFLNTSGNFVFPGIVPTEGEGNQYIVDDCFLKHYGTPHDLTTRDTSHPLDEAHYWFVEGNKYFFNTTLTAYTYQEALDFNLTDNDPNIILSGIERNSLLSIKKIEWVGTHRNKYQPVLPNEEVGKVDDYEFDIEVGGKGTDAWSNDMPRYTAGNINASDPYLTTAIPINTDEIPQFNIKLQDKLDNSGEAKYVNHLDEPEVVKIYLEGVTTDGNGDEMTYEYTITLNIVYLQGPTFEGGVDILNCALPGERIGFSSGGIRIKTPELMPVTAASWQILPLLSVDDGVYKWDYNHGIVIPESMYSEVAGVVQGEIPALYCQNEYNIAYIFTAGGHNFPVLPDQANPKKENRMMVVHNYHRMKDVVPQNLQLHTMAIVPGHAPFAEAKVYIENEEDLRAMFQYINMATADNPAGIPTGLTGLDIILQDDITLTSSLPTLSQDFAGNLHGNGYHIDLGEHATTLFADNLTGTVYNLGMIGGTIAGAGSTGRVVNSYEYEDNTDIAYGRKAYELSHYFTPTHEGTVEVADADNYVKDYYRNGDYQYATTDLVWSLRTGTPDYGRTSTRHITEHTHDAARWVDDDDTADADILAEEGHYVPLYDGTREVADIILEDGQSMTTYRGLPLGYANDYLFFGQHLDPTNADPYPTHISRNATGDDAYVQTDKAGWKGGNRVYETAGFYQSKADEKFYYNMDAWAVCPELTAIDYTHMTAEADNAATLPSAFHVDSNRDYGAYSNASYGHVTQNLLVYNAGEDVFDQKDLADIEERDVVYHNIAWQAGTFSTDYLHLVDRQDFNAPIAFDVRTRAWYERLPQDYRNLIDTDDADEEVDYDSSSAWEGICLPFTATKVTAEKNGEITHFYGEQTDDAELSSTRTLHHEYWLAGFTAIDGDKATFARPAASGTGVFVESHQTAAKHDYTYLPNTYFTSLFNYGNHYDTRDDEGADTFDEHDEAWYAQPHTFADYAPLTASVPYLVAFPGDDFYEFSMESYYREDAYGSVTYHQKALFESGATTIAVTDDNAVSTTVGTHTHRGTFLHLSDCCGVNDEGSAFESGQAILPFRTHMTTTPSHVQERRIRIYDGNDGIGFHPDNEGEELTPEALEGKALNIYVLGKTLVVESNYATTLRLYTLSGMCARTLQVDAGINKYGDIQNGFYIIGGKKILLK